jgi:ATP-dependent helicase HepA
VVRRVTEDPIQRFLLADEVGLGKTIEAAAIVAQALLDHPDDRIVIAAPRTLLRQWRDELSLRFGLDPEQLTLVPFEDIPEVDSDETDFLVVDEVHHLVAGSSSYPDAYQQLRHIAHAAPRLLLLSATPVLADPRSTLALLALLDPDQYRLEDIGAFERLLSNRQEYGRVLLTLNPSTAPLLLRRAIAKIQQLAPDDQDARDLAEHLASAIDDGDAPTVAASVRLLRDHITETYRLNRRLLRTRRRDTEGWEMASRESDLVVEVDEDSRVESASDALEEWRYRAVLSLQGTAFSDPNHVESAEEALIVRFVGLLEALGRSVDAFVAAFRELHGGPTFPEEADIRRRVLELEADGQDSDRNGLAAAIIDLTLRGTMPRTPGASAKVVAFASDGSIARQVAADIAKRRGFGVCHLVTSDLDEDTIERAVRAFRAARVPSVLLADRSGEEGLNLQFADAVVHLDLPLEPMRIEQRIGRLDRIGRDAGRIRHRVVIPSDDEQSPWFQWLEVCRSGLKVFSESIADMQFALDGILHEARTALFRHGADGLREFMPRSRELILDERRRLDEQYALDRLEMGEADGHVLFAQLQEAEQADRALASSMTAWWHDVLRLERSVPENAAAGLFSLSWTDSTLAPREPWHDLLAPALDTPLTFERTAALRNLGARLVRSGNPLAETLTTFLRHDDRGTAFVTWRLEPTWPADDPWIGFKLVYVVELDAEAVAARLWPHPDAVGVAALQRRADVLFPPWVETHFVDTSLASVSDPEILDILSRPYQKERGPGGRRDFNLAGRLGGIRAMVDPLDVRRWCKEVRETAPQLIRMHPNFERRLLDAHGRADRELTVQAERLSRRRAAQRRAAGSSDPTLDLEISAVTEILRELKTPSVRLESVGLFVVSDQHPSSAVGEL